MAGVIISADWITWVVVKFSLKKEEVEVNTGLVVVFVEKCSVSEVQDCL